MRKITLTQAYLMGIGCKDCNEWTPTVVNIGKCKRQGAFGITEATEICEHWKEKEE